MTAAAGVLAIAVAAAGAATAQDAATAPSRDLVVQAPGSSLALPRTVEPQTSRGGVDREVLARQTAVQAQQRSRALAALTEKNRRRAAQLKSQAKRAAALRAANQWVLPTTGYRLTARFGQTSALWSTVHTGLDFAAPEGTPLVSVAHGTVTEVAYSGAYGNRTIITLDDGTEIWYCHQSATSVSAGDEVDPGDAIGAIGSTGNVTGPHLHLEVRPDGGDPVDPYTALQDHDVNP